MSRFCGSAACLARLAATLDVDRAGPVEQQPCSACRDALADVFRREADDATASFRGYVR